MVSYYNSSNMYRHPQGVPTPPNASGVHSWYAATGYHHQAAAAAAAQMSAPEQHMWDPQNWHPHGHVPPPHSVFNNGDFPEFMHSGAVAVHGGENHGQLMPSPTITVSGSELSSPGVENNGGSPQSHHHHHHQHGHQTQVSRPPPARSPYDWMRKTSYQSQPNPETESQQSSSESVLFDSSEAQGKTRTKDKYRVVYTDHQRVELEKEFYYSRYITIRRKAELASNLGLSERQVKIWFQNRRAKERKQVKKREEFTQKDGVSMAHMTQPAQQLIHSNQTQIAQNLLTPQIM